MMKRKVTKKGCWKHSGFSMVEVMIALAILSIITLIVFRFLGTSSRTYGKTNAEVTLQSEAQLVANAIKELIIDCQVKVNYYDETTPFTEGTNVYKNALLIMNDDEQFLIYQNDEAGHEDELLFLTRNRADGDADTFDTAFIKEKAEVLANYVSDFSVDLSRQPKENIVEFSFKYTFDKREYKGKYQVYMRNKVVIDPDTNYEPSNKQEISQVLVSPTLVTITPDTSTSQDIAQAQQFKAVVRTSGTLDRKVNWALNVADTGCSINEDGLLKIDSEPSKAEFKVIATSDVDNTKSGSATVRVKKVSDVTVQAVSGITGMVDGVESATRNTKVLFVSKVNGWNLTSLDQSVIWKLEYRPNYSTGSDYNLLTEFDVKKGTYVNHNTNVGQINASGLLTLGKNATNNFEFRITAIATFPNYGKPLTYKSESTLLRIKNEEVKFDGGFVRGLDVDLMAYFLSGQAQIDNAVPSDVIEIKNFIKAESSDGYELDPNLISLKDGKFYIDYDVIHYQSQNEFKKFFEQQKFNIWFNNQNDQSSKMEITYPAVSIKRGTPEKEYIVISKGSTMDIDFSYVGYNVTKSSQIGIYIDGEKVSADGSSDVNQYLSSYLRTTNDSGESALGTKTKYVDKLKTRLSVSSSGRYYPKGAIPYRITLDDFYQVSGMDNNSYIEYDVYVANVQGQKLYVPGPSETESFPAVTDQSKKYKVGPENTSVELYRQDNKVYMKYASRTYVYDEIYSYWKLK